MLEELKKFIGNEKNLAEQFVEEYKPEEHIILCGGGYALYWYCKFFEWKHIKPDFVIDQNYSGGEKFGIPVVTYDFVLQNLDLNVCKFVITAPKYKHEIYSDIKNIFGNVRIYSFEAEIFYTFIRDVSEYRKYLIDNFNKIEWLYHSLEDEKSKETLCAFFKGRVTGEQDWFINTMVPDQYFPKDIIKLGNEEVIVEAGSNDGRTLLDIIDRTKGVFKKIYCFEPDRECIDLLEGIIGKSDKPIELIKKGVGLQKDKLYFKTDSKWGASRIVSSEDYDYFIEVTSMDEELEGVPVSYIKMDIEGMELNCLKGAENIIKKYSPKLSVCIYHNKEDILEIPYYLKSINPNYKFYLRHHNWGATETVLYAIV